MNRKANTISLYEFLQRIPDEKSARNYFEEMRWSNGRYCPHCKSTNTVEVKDEKPQPYRCKNCRKHFSVRTGTVLTSSNIPLQKWLLATYLMSTAKKSMSSCHMARELGVTQKTAWFLCMRIREIWTNPIAPFTGTVETDETYLGGKEDNRHYDKKTLLGEHGTKGKQIVLGVRERSGKVNSRIAKSTKESEIHKFIMDTVQKGSNVYSDDHKSYTDLVIKGFSHESVNHSKKEYVRGNIHTNGIESFWALLKRGYHGTFHHYSHKHASRYINEFVSRINNKGYDTEAILALTIKSSNGKSLPYKELIRGS